VLDSIYEAALAMRFAEATLNYAPEADDLREEVVRKFGKRGLIKAVRRQPFRKCVGFEERAINLLGLGRQDTMQTHGVRHGGFSSLLN
jgi:hypothetical protein